MAITSNRGRFQKRRLKPHLKTLGVREFFLLTAPFFFSFFLNKVISMMDSLE